MTPQNEYLIGVLANEAEAGNKLVGFSFQPDGNVRLCIPLDLSIEQCQALVGITMRHIETLKQACADERQGATVQ